MGRACMVAILTNKLATSPLMDIGISTTVATPRTAQKNPQVSRDDIVAKDVGKVYTLA